MEDIAAPLPKMKLNSRGQIIHSKNYDLEIDKEIYFLLIEILIDNTSARVKWDRMFKSAWIITLVFGAINVFILQMF